MKADNIKRRDFLTATTMGIAIASMSNSASGIDFLEDDTEPSLLTSAFSAND